jgi:SAM-dependent methyltransferase
MLATGINALFLGFDISVNMLKTAKRSVDNSKVELIAADGFEMPLRQHARFDLIHIDSVLHHLVGSNRDKSMQLVNLFCNQIMERLSADGRIVVEEIYYVSHLFPTISSRLIFYGLKLLNLLHIDASKIMNEFNPGLEVNFLSDKEIEKLLGSYGTVYLINKTPWPRPKLYRLLFLKDLGHITYMITAPSLAE